MSVSKCVSVSDLDFLPDSKSFRVLPLAVVHKSDLGLVLARPDVVLSVQSDSLFKDVLQQLQRLVVLPKHSQRHCLVGLVNQDMFVILPEDALSDWNHFVVNPDSLFTVPFGSGYRPI